MNHNKSALIFQKVPLDFQWPFSVETDNNLVPLEWAMVGLVLLFKKLIVLLFSYFRFEVE